MCACMSITILNNIYPRHHTTGTRARVAADGWKNAAMSQPLDSTSFETTRKVANLEDVSQLLFPVICTVEMLPLARNETC